MNSKIVVDDGWGAGWMFEKEGLYAEAIARYEAASANGSILARKRLDFLNGLGEILYMEPECITDNWFDYESLGGNIKYAGFYSYWYHLRNRIAFQHLFCNYFRDRSSINIAIIGGGNGWELDDIYDIIDEQCPNMVVNCTVIDPVLWKFGHVEVHMMAGRPVKYVRGRIGQFGKGIDPAYLSDYDLVYFARCINYCDNRSLSLEWLRNRTAILSRSTLVAFHQVDQPETRWHSYQYEQEFENVFEGVIQKCHTRSEMIKESLYVMEG